MNFGILPIGKVAWTRISQTAVPTPTPSTENVTLASSSGNPLEPESSIHDLPNVPPKAFLAPLRTYTMFPGADMSAPSRVICDPPYTLRAYFLRQFASASDRHPPDNHETLSTR